MWAVDWAMVRRKAVGRRDVLAVWRDGGLGARNAEGQR